MAEVLSFNEFKVKKGYEEMAAVKLCSNYDNNIVVKNSRTPLEKRNIEREMIAGYLKLLSNFNN